MDGGVNGKAIGIVEEDMGDGMQCSEHPCTKNPGGICGFCLQEKLGKLVTSSLPLAITKISSSSSSSSPSFRSDIASSSTSVRPGYENPNPSGYNNQYCTRRPKPKTPFYLAKCNSSNKKKKDGDIVYGRTKSSNSSAMPKARHFLDEDSNYSPRKRSGFWSFLYFSSPSSKSESFKSCTTNGSGSKLKVKSSESRGSNIVENSNEDGDCSPNSQFERKVSRSRSVGCGSRSFSGDFFERISNGFGDCTLRRVESQREGKAAKNSRHDAAASSSMKERVKCGGIFGGFMVMNSFSSSSSSSSSYWASTTSSSEEVSRKVGTRQQQHQLVHGRSRSWSWVAFASPMRAFNRPSSSSSKRGNVNININLNHNVKAINKEASASSSSNTNINPTQNLNAVPSLLTVGG